MSLFDKRSELKQLAKTAFTKLIERLNQQFEKKEIYGLVFLPSSGYVDLGISYSTSVGLAKHSSSMPPGLDSELVDMLKDHPDLLKSALTYDAPKLYFEVNACEWDCVRSNEDLFTDVNDIIGSEYDSLYDDGVDNGEICRFFEGLLTEILSELKVSGTLKSPAFVDDVLLGIQFPDSDNPDAVMRVSKAVNSITWHEKVCKGYDSDS